MNRVKKSCPICGKTEWDSDVYNGLHTFCGDCHFYFRHEAHKKYPKFNTGSGELLSMGEYRTAIALAKTAKKENRMY